MDAEGTVNTTVSKLRENMDRYDRHRGHWVAPYTSLVTSSMMGKSRHMKEVANCLPSIYICLRGTEAIGYPRRSPGIVEYLSQGIKGIMGRTANQSFKEVNFYASTLK
jgi:hypothetical protein